MESLTAADPPVIGEFRLRAQLGAAVANGTVYFSAGQSVQAVDAMTGSTTWSYAPPDSVEFGAIPAVGGGLVFIGARDDSLYAIRA